MSTKVETCPGLRMSLPAAPVHAAQTPCVLLPEGLCPLVLLSKAKRNANPCFWLGPAFMRPGWSCHCHLQHPLPALPFLCGLVAVLFTPLFLSFSFFLSIRGAACFSETPPRWPWLVPRWSSARVWPIRGLPQEVFGLELDKNGRRVHSAEEASLQREGPTHRRGTDGNSRGRPTAGDLSSGMSHPSL